MSQEYLPKQQFEEEMAAIRRELTSKSDQEQSQRVVVSQVLMDICNFWLKSDSESDNIVLAREPSKKAVISDFLEMIEAWMQPSEVGKETTQMEAAASPMAGTKLITATSSSKKVADQKNEAMALPKQPAGFQTQPAPEGKAAKIERLKSGFGLCRPQGAFLLPNMVNPATNTVTTPTTITTTIKLPAKSKKRKSPSSPSGDTPSCLPNRAATCDASDDPHFSHG